MIFDYFGCKSVILAYADEHAVVRAKQGPLDPADKQAVRQHKYVVIYDGARKRICHVGFLREDSAGEIDRCLRRLRW